MGLNFMMIPLFKNGRGECICFKVSLSNSMRRKWYFLVLVG